MPRLSRSLSYFEATTAALSHLQYSGGKRDLSRLPEGANQAVLLKLLMLIAAIATVLAIALLVIGMRQRQRRRVSRARREGDYAERRTTWRDYLSRNRKPRRLTDERAVQD